MASIGTKAESILSENLNSGLGYIITTEINLIRLRVFHRKSDDGRQTIARKHWPKNILMY